MLIGLVADSTAYLTQEQKTRYRIELVPINVHFEGRIYQDGVDLSIAQAYQFLEKNPKDWATSAPSPGNFLTAFRKLSEQGAKEILCLTLPQSVSATWNSARMAKNLAQTEIPGVRIEVMDSGTAAVGETLMLLKIAEAIEKGANFQEIIKLAETLRSKIRVYILLETIRYIYRSGRIPEVASKLGALLPLKPILGIHGGKLHFTGATTSMGKSKERIIKNLKEAWDGNLPEIGLTYIDNSDETREIKEEISSLLPSSHIYISEFSPIVGYATGQGTIAVGYFVK
jgi:DegV family protein with EDD domain